VWRRIQCLSQSGHPSTPPLDEKTNRTPSEPAKPVVKQLNLRENRFGIEPEITAKVAKMGCRIYEVGIAYSGRTYAEGKKITWRDGLSAIRCIIQYNLFQ